MLGYMLFDSVNIKLIKKDLSKNIDIYLYLIQELTNVKLDQMSMKWATSRIPMSQF